jgi:hypothetical protein
LSDYNPAIERLLAASSSTKKKPTFRIKLFGSGNQLEAASSISMEREKAEKASRLNSCKYVITKRKIPLLGICGLAGMAILVSIR